ncbi:hypothetical protein SAMN05518672_1138 [Chitinophaga sp. CF118]|uniref:hypothetical protein n=1 Tax=Chitinophaga sp. CF118 TaxID=1884367 RepID=UPI0008EC65D8|nr:hypothetical protein [Chitinophaga sp. CF118]SFE95484.1 hypothetical protein SAMN05518672_1138 [Chitinophaga sp. CF118]
MKKITNIFQALSLSFFLAGTLAVVAMNAHASDNIITDKNKDKIKKTESGLSLMPKANLSLDAGFRYSGSMNSTFKLSSDNNNAVAFNIKSVMSFKKGNVTYVLPYATQVQQPSNMNFHHLQIVLPLKRN